MAGFEEYTFKPAPVRAAQTWAIREGHLMRRGASKAFPLDQVDRVVYGTFAYRGTRSTWLHIRVDGEVCKLACNDGGDGTDHDSFLGLVIAVLDAMPRDLPVHYDGGSVFSRVMFLIGILGTVAGAVFLFAGLSGNVSQNEGVAIGLGLGMIAGLGFLAWIYRPWRPPALARPEELSALLRAELGQTASGTA